MMNSRNLEGKEGGRGTMTTYGQHQPAETTSIPADFYNTFSPNKIVTMSRYANMPFSGGKLQLEGKRFRMSDFIFYAELTKICGHSVKKAKILFTLKRN